MRVAKAAASAEAGARALRPELIRVSDKKLQQDHV